VEGFACQRIVREHYGSGGSSQLRNRDTTVKEGSSAMPIEIDITENAMFKWGQERGEAKS
jgi:hypothetical protein